MSTEASGNRVLRDGYQAEPGYPPHLVEWISSGILALNPHKEAGGDPFLLESELEIPEATLAEAIDVEVRIPEFSGAKLARQASRLDGAESLSILALWAGAPAGYKVGYALNESEFYSWLGGVLPPFRQQGIADRL